MFHIIIFYCCRLLHNGGQLIAVHKGRYYRTEDGLSLGPGSHCFLNVFSSQSARNYSYKTSYDVICKAVF